MKSDLSGFDVFVQYVRAVFFELRRTSNGLLEQFECTAVERSVLQELSHERLTVPDLAHRRAISRQAMQKTIDGLVVKGILDTTSNPRHLRSPLIELTSAGRQLFDDIRAFERRALSSNPLPVSDRELREAATVLQKMAQFLAELSPQFASTSGSGHQS